MFRSSPPQLATLVRGQRVRNGPFVVTVTDEMVRERERLNAELAVHWQRAQQPGPLNSEYFDEFQELKVRRRFVARVFLLVTLQLAFTASLIAVSLFVKEVKDFIWDHHYTMFIATLLFLLMLVIISFCEEARGGFLGVVCLVVLTVSLAYAAAVLSTTYSTGIVLVAACSTAIITLTICCLAACTSWDMTKNEGLVTIVFMAGGLGLLMIYLVTALLPGKHHGLELLMSIITTLLFSMMLWYEVQTIMGGRVVAVLPNEVVFATALLYVQIVMIYKILLMCKC